MNAQKSMIVADRASLSAIRYVEDLEHVTIVTAKLKHRNLLPCALKYALWAVRPGGRIVVDDAGSNDPAQRAFEVSNNLVRQWVARFIGRDVAWTSIDSAGRIELERTRPVLRSGWSAGVVFSGADSEVPVLQRSLDGLLAQPELQTRNGGEVVVCGPERNLDFLKSYPDVRYERFESPSGERFFIGRKKNALMRSMKGPRMVVLHARIVLEPGALAGVPREFDMSSPNTVVVADGKREAYLSLCQTSAVWPGVVPNAAPVLMRHLKSTDDQLRLHELGGLFVDGGAFYVTKELFEQCPLHDDIAWNEAEDVEWCGRAFSQGFLIDMAPRSPAYSQTSKLRPRPQFGRWTELIWSAYRMRSDVTAALSDRFQRFKGLR